MPYSSRIFRTALMLAATSAACGTEGRLPQDEDLVALSAARAPQWSVAHEVTLDGDFGRIADLEVDAQGILYVADAMAQEIRVFAKDGSALETIGRRGRGPGEFQGLRDLAVRGDSLYALDSSLQRVSAFYLRAGHPAEPAYSLSVARSREWANYQLLAPPGGGLLVQYSIPSTEANLDADKTVTVRRLGGGDARSVDVLSYADREFLVMRHPRFGFVVGTLPYGRVTVLRMAPDGRLLLGRSDSLRVDAYGLDGRRVGGFRHERSLPAVERGEVQALLASYSEDRMGRAEREVMKAAAREDRIPRSMPAFGTFLVDDRSRVWLDPLRSGDRMTSAPSGLQYARTPTADGTVPWWVLDEDGSVAAAAALPTTLTPLLVRDGRVYGIQLDETGVERIASYRVIDP